MNKGRIAYSIIAIVLGVCMFVYGGMDDSPGAQGLGLLAVIIGIVVIVKSRRRQG